MYRSWRQTVHQKKGPGGAGAPDADDGDLKNFYIKVALNKESITAVSVSFNQEFTLNHNCLINTTSDVRMYFLALREWPMIKN